MACFSQRLRPTASAELRKSAISIPLKGSDLSCERSEPFCANIRNFWGKHQNFFCGKAPRRLLHKGESRCCFRDSALVTYGGMLPSDLTLSALRFILSAKPGQSCEQDCDTVDFCNSITRVWVHFLREMQKEPPDSPYGSGDSY